MASGSTTLPDGEYCNVYSTQDCSQTVTVADGKVTTTIPARSAVALYGGATKTSHPAASATTDPSDPENVIKDETVKPTDTTLTVYYKNDNKYEQPYIHYGVGSTWTDVPGKAMTYDKTSGYWKYIIETGGNAVQYVFNDGSNSWNNPNGGGNYEAAAGIVQQTVTDHASTVGSPKPTTRTARPVSSPTTRLLQATKRVRCGCGVRTPIPPQAWTASRSNSPAPIAGVKSPSHLRRHVHRFRCHRQRQRRLGQGRPERSQCEGRRRRHRRDLGGRHRLGPRADAHRRAG